MKNSLPYFIIIGLSLLLIFRSEHTTTRVDVVRDTVFSIDTVKVSIPAASSETIVRYSPYPVVVPGDTITVHDTVFVYIPITQKVYRDSLYTAWVSGYSAKLDSIELYNRERTIFIHDKAKRKRFGLGIQAGYGYPHGGYVGVGISYNLFNW